jgi:hypothetical protein
MCPVILLVGPAPGTPEHKKWCINIPRPECTRVHNVSHRSHRMQKHNSGITSPGMVLMGSTPGPPEHEKYCVNVSRTGCPQMHYVTHRSHEMQKYKFDVTCPGALLVVCALGQPSMKNSSMHPNTLREPQVAPDVKRQVRHNVSLHPLYGIRIGPTRARKIVCRRLVPRTHPNALHDPRIAPDAKNISSA